MVQIIEQLLDPMRISAGTSGVSLGDIVGISYDDFGVSCKLSNSRNPFGIVVGLPNEYGQVLVLCGMDIIKINNYDLTKNYKVGDLLYSNDIGKLTNGKCEDGSLLLGHVLELPSELGSWMEINWI